MTAWLLRETRTWSALKEIVARTVPHRVQIGGHSQDAWVSAEAVAQIHWPNGWLDSTTALDHRPDGSVAPLLLGMFIVRAPVLAVATHLLHIMLWSILLFGFQAVVGGIMRASGTVIMPVSISIASILLVQLPSAYLLSAQLGLEGVWMSYPIVFGTMLALQGSYYGLVWRHKKIKRLV